MKYRKLVSMLMASVLLVTGIQPGSMLSVSAETEPAEAALSGAEPLATSDNSFGAMLAASINEQQAQIQSGCNIYNVEMFGNAARVHFDASRDGKLVVALYEDIGGEQAPRLIGTGMQEVAAGEQQDEYVTISTFASMPEYYLIRAYLIGSNGMPLSPEYENPMHTKEMINLLGSDINDYAGYEVLNLDDDVNTNFAVYNTDVTVLKSSSTENVVTEQDPETGVYKISNYTGPTRSGEFVSIEGDGNSVTIFKIKSVTKSGSVTTVYANTDAETSDAFAFIKIETDSSRDQVSYTPPEDSEVPVTGEVVSNLKKQKRPAAASAQAAEAEASEEVLSSDYFSVRLRFGNKTEDDSENNPVKINGGVDINFSYKIAYYKTEDFKKLGFVFDFDIQCSVECCLTAELRIPFGTISTVSPFGETEFRLGPYFIISITGKVILSGLASAHISSDSGINLEMFKPDLELGAEGFFGFGIGGAAKILGKGFDLDIVFSLLKVELSVAEKHDGCGNCFEGKISVDLTFSFSADLLVFDFAREFSFGTALGKCYISDTLGFGWGECPNKNKHGSGSETDPDQEDEDDGLTDDERKMFQFTRTTINGVSGYAVGPKNHNAVCDIEYLNFPDYYKGKPVIQIGDGAYTAFGNCIKLKSIKFPEHLMLIEDLAFSGSGSSDFILKLPDNGVTIRGAAFSSAKIKELIFPDNDAAVNSIPKSAFNYARIESATIPKGVTSFRTKCLTETYGLETVKFPSSLTEIGDRAFYGCPRLKIDLPNTVKTIGKEAFACPSTYLSFVHEYYRDRPIISYTLTLPVMLESIGPNAFEGRENIDKMVIPDFIHLKPVENVGYYWFGLMPKLQEIVMPSDWTLIPWGFAERMPALERVTMPAFVKTIQPHAFQNTLIRTISIPDTVQIIEPQAFYDCKNLMEIDIPSSVKKISYLAFCGCESLESIVIPESVDTLFFSAFRSMKNLKSVTILNPNVKIDDKFMFDPIYETGDVWDKVRDCLLWNREQLVIYGYEGSTAQQFAENPKYNFKFVALEKPAAGTTTAGTTSSGTTPAGTTPVTEPEQPKDEPKTITFTDLKPNTIYNFYDLLGDEFIAENLLYLSQGVSDENGTLTIWYRPAKDDTDANKFVKRFVSQPVITVAGDLTCDGHVDVSDAVALLRFLNEDKSVKISDQGITNADANRNGQVDSDDCTVILQFIARIIREI